MIDKDPALIVRDLLLDAWNASNTSLPDRPAISTGWYDFGSGGPQVTITNTNEFVIGGGDTGHSGGTGDGEPVQIRAGTVMVNGWSGSRDDLAGAAADGGDINPKQMSFELAAEIHRIVQNTASGVDGLNSLGADQVQAIAETDAPEVVYRREVTVKYTYIT